MGFSLTEVSGTCACHQVWPQQLCRSTSVSHRTKKLPNGQRATGELHIVTVQPRSDVEETGWKSDDLAVLVILLELPQEGALTTPIERWLLHIGMGSIPDEGEPLALPGEIDLKVFKTLIDESEVVQLPCTSGNTAQFVFAKPAFVSGLVVDQFRTRFPNPANYTSNLDENALNSLLGQGDGMPNLQTENQKIAYATGEWAIGPPEKPKPVNFSEIEFGNNMVAAMGGL